MLLKLWSCAESIQLVTDQGSPAHGFLAVLPDLEVHRTPPMLPIKGGFQ